MKDHVIEFDEAKHQYKVDGEVKPSVTTILNYLTAEGYAAINPAILEQAKTRGTMVHELTAQIDFDMVDEEIPSEMVGYAKAYELFLDDYMPDWEGVEYPFYCEDDGGYCGTIDRFGYVMGEMSVVDIKTTSSPTSEQIMSVCAQTNAYGRAVQGAKRHFSLYLKNTGEYKLVDLDEWAKKHDFDGLGFFKTCHSFYNNIQEVKENVKRRRKK